MRNSPRRLLFACAALASILVGCNGAAATQEGASANLGNSTGTTAGSTTVEVTTVSGRPHVEKIELPGASVHGFETTLLMAKIGGYVGEIKQIQGKDVDIGTLVKKGDDLVVLDIPEMKFELQEKAALIEKSKSAVIQADAAIGQAKAELNRRKSAVKMTEALRLEKMARHREKQAVYKRIARLVEDGAIGTENLDEAKYALDAAESALVSLDAEVETVEFLVDVAEENIKKAEADKIAAQEDVKVVQAVWSHAKAMERYASIPAPFDGMITKRMVDHGAFVRPATSNSGATPLFEVTRTDKVRVVVSVPTVKARNISVGDQAIFHSIGGLPGVVITGRVARSASALGQTSRMMRIEVDFDNPYEQPLTGKRVTLTPGMYGTIRVVLKEWERIPILPTSAVARDETGGSYVMVVDINDNICHKRRVEIAFNDAKDVGIRSGVNLGDTVVLDDIEDLSDNQKISVKSP